MQKIDEQGLENGEYTVSYSFSDGVVGIVKLSSENEVKSLLQIHKRRNR